MFGRKVKKKDWKPNVIGTSRNYSNQWRDILFAFFMHCIVFGVYCDFVFAQRS